VGFITNVILLTWGSICLWKCIPAQSLFILLKEALEEKLVQLGGELLGNRHPVPWCEGTIALLSLCSWR